MKHKRNTNDTKHLEDAFLTTPIASNTDTTGYVPTLPLDTDSAENLEEMMNVPVSRPTKKK